MSFLQLDYIRAKTFHGKYDTGDRKTDLENWKLTQFRWDSSPPPTTQKTLEPGFRFVIIKSDSREQRAPLTVLRTSIHSPPHAADMFPWKIQTLVCERLFVSDIHHISPGASLQGDGAILSVRGRCQEQVAGQHVSLCPPCHAVYSVARINPRMSEENLWKLMCVTNLKSLCISVHKNIDCRDMRGSFEYITHSQICVCVWYWLLI